MATGSAELALALVCSEQLESRMVSLRVETCHWTANMHAARVHSFMDATCGCLVLPQRFPKVISSGWVGGVDSMIRESRMARGGSPVWNPKSRRLRHARRRFSGRTVLSVCSMSLRAVGNRLGPSGHPQTLLKYAQTALKRSNWAQKQRFGHLGEIGKISDFDLELRRRFCSDTAQLWKS